MLALQCLSVYLNIACYRSHANCLFLKLITISGFPCSGKTYRSRQLVDFFQSKIAESTDARVSKIAIRHINEEPLGLSRDVYSTARFEKDARATEMSAVKRFLSRDSIVIADGLNYIKGYRYQLHCEAKAVQTPSCVVCRHIVIYVHHELTIQRCMLAHRPINAASSIAVD